MTKQMQTLGLLLVIIVLPPTTSLAGQITSAYTKIILPGTSGAKANCIDISPPGTGAEATDHEKWTCKGYANWAVDVAHGRGRYSVYFRPGSAPVVDYWQSLSGIHSIGKTLEWRLDAGRPFAAILRHFPQWDDTGLEIKKSQTLVVWKVSKARSCHVAYIDVRGKGNANEKARKAADTLARGFDCAKDEIVYIGPLK